jgi:hypothetical protein
VREVSDRTWRKSSYSSSQPNCVELATSAVRDSKDPHGPVLSADVAALVAAVKAGQLA